VAGPEATGFRKKKAAASERAPVGAAVARPNDGAVPRLGDEILKEAHVAFPAAVDVESHSRILHEADHAQQLGVHAKGGADL